ncbi:hypothetical protein [Methanosarcina sp. KYL-1]|nr:hypothetical protein [Methanosarcina sp. KYL-1]
MGKAIYLNIFCPPGAGKFKKEAFSVLEQDKSLASDPDRYGRVINTVN